MPQRAEGHRAVGRRSQQLGRRRAPQQATPQPGRSHSTIAFETSSMSELLEDIADILLICVTPSIGCSSILTVYFTLMSASKGLAADIALFQTEIGSG